jgi:type II secretory pathway component PulC
MQRLLMVVLGLLLVAPPVFAEDPPRISITEDALTEAFLDHAAGDVKVKKHKKGWQLRGIKPDSGLWRLGLVDGDVVVAVDGVKLTSVAQLRRANETLHARGQLDFALEREGAALTVRWELAGWKAPPVDYSKDVTVVDGNTVRVSAALVERITSDPRVVAGELRVVPSIANGKPNGYKLFAIRTTSLPKALGFENGDTVHSLNGLAFAGADADVLEQLKTAKELRVKLTRRGAALERVIVIEGR